MITLGILGPFNIELVSFGSLLTEFCREKERKLGLEKESFVLGMKVLP